MNQRIRLDLALQARGLLPSRARARDAVLRGVVLVNGVPAERPHQPVGPDDAIELRDPAAAYVSRAAVKLLAGLDAAGIGVAGRTCLDLGASTGGFTQVLLERGAARVFAVDVGHGQLHEKVATDPRVTALEGRNGRDLDRSLIPIPIDLLVCDISFVSVLKVLDRPLALCSSDADAVILIKPQFEVGRDRIGKGGIVSDAAATAGAAESVLAFLADRGWRHRVTIPSPITGGDGNQELVAVFRKPLEPAASRRAPG